MMLRVNGRATYVYTGGVPLDRRQGCTVLLHGALNDHSVWSGIARILAAQGMPALAPDLPAHGRSDGPPAADIGAAADWVLALLAAAQVPAVTLVGHSMGSLIALEAAARATLPVAHLVLVATAVPMPVAPALLAQALEQPLQAIDRIAQLSLSGRPGLGPAGAPAGLWAPGALRALMRHLQQGWPDGNLMRHDFGCCNDHADGLAAAARVRCPATVVSGTFDSMTRPAAAAAVAAALRAKTVSLPTGHAVMTEAPSALAQLLGRLAPEPETPHAPAGWQA